MPAVRSLRFSPSASVLLTKPPLVPGVPLLPGLVGLSLSYALSLTGLLSGLVSSFTQTETMLVSVERLEEYSCDLPQEPQGRPRQVGLHLCPRPGVWNPEGPSQRPQSFPKFLSFHSSPSSSAPPMSPHDLPLLLCVPHPVSVLPSLLHVPSFPPTSSHAIHFSFPLLPLSTPPSPHVSPSHPSPPPPTHEPHQLGTGWLTRGSVEFQDVVLVYRPGLPNALDGVTFCVQPGEKLGIVGRTGSGKSSLLLVLFRLLEPSSGRVLLDGVDTSQLALAELRSEGARRGEPGCWHIEEA